MDSLTQLFSGFSDLFTDPVNLVLIIVGVLLGTVAGLLPGLGPSTAIALLLPLALTLDPVHSLVMMVSLYLGAEYGGRISAILLNIPGDPGALMTTLDGYPMAQQGRGSAALAISAIASFVGSLLAIIGLVFLAIPMADVALAFGPNVYVAIVIMALLLSGTLVGGSILKGMIAILLGLIIATVGTDLQTGVPRFTLGMSGLLEGIDLIIPIIGVFGVGEVLWNLKSRSQGEMTSIKTDKFKMPRPSELREISWTTIRGSFIGFIAGVLPGSGTTLAAFFSYSLEKRVSKTPEKFGTGVVKGVAAPESANNAAVGGSMVPMLSLGIPGSGTTAVLLAYLAMYGLEPGPTFFANHGDIAWAMIAALFVSAFAGLILNLPLAPVFAKILDIPQAYLFPMIMVLASIAAFSLNNSIFDVGMVLVFGVVGYLLRLVNISPALVVIGAVLGTMLERNLRQAWILANGDLAAMVLHPMVIVFLMIGIAAVALDLVSKARRKRKVADIAE